MTTAGLRWAARLVLTSPRVGDFLAQAVEALATSRLVECAGYELGSGAGHATFEFTLRTTLVSDPVAVARQTLTLALHEAQIGTPYPPVGLTDVAVALVLADAPTIIDRGAS